MFILWSLDMQLMVIILWMMSAMLVRRVKCRDADSRSFQAAHAHTFSHTNKYFRQWQICYPIRINARCLAVLSIKTVVCTQNMAINYTIPCIFSACWYVSLAKRTHTIMLAESFQSNKISKTGENIYERKFFEFFFSAPLL